MSDVRDAVTLVELRAIVGPPDEAIPRIAATIAGLEREGCRASRPRPPRRRSIG